MVWETIAIVEILALGKLVHRARPSPSAPSAPRRAATDSFGWTTHAQLAVLTSAVSILTSTACSSDKEAVGGDSSQLQRLRSACSLWWVAMLGKEADFWYTLCTLLT